MGRSGGLKNKKKKDLGAGRRRATSTDVSDTESEDSCYQVYTNERMTPLEAKQKAVKEQLKREEEEEMIRQEELAVKKKEEDEKKKAIMEAKQKAAAEKAAELEAKRKAEEEKK